MDEKLEVIVTKNSQIPLKKSKEFTTVVDRQKSVKCSIYEGEKIDVEQNLTGKFHFE